MNSAGDRVAIGALSNDGSDNSAGHVRVFKLTPIPDNTPPTITSVSSTTDNGSYKAGDAITITISFSENVFVNSNLFQEDGTGRPRLTLETGSSDQGVNYTSGSGGPILTWTYVVVDGNSSSEKSISLIGTGSDVGLLFIYTSYGSVPINEYLPCLPNSADSNKYEYSPPCNLR